ncbi:MAG: hypothetical protein FWG99_00760 [Treponema sp.]|nr:hypothetical protein [Treponema sp.]
MKIKTGNLILALMLFTLVLAACPTKYPDLPPKSFIAREILADIEAKLGGIIVAVMEAEDGRLTKTNPGFDTGTHSSGSASEGKFVKGIGVGQAYVEVTIPNNNPYTTAPISSGTYGIGIGWSGSPNGYVQVTLRPGRSDEVMVNVRYERPDGVTNWDMSDPQYLAVMDTVTAKAGDIIRIQNGEVPGTDATIGEDPNAPGTLLNYIHLDVVYLFTPNEPE